MKRMGTYFNKTKLVALAAILLAIGVFWISDPHYWYQCERIWKLILYNISDWILLASPFLIIIGAIFLFKGWPWWLILTGVVLLIFLTLATFQLHSGPLKSSDQRRISNIKQMQLALELYFDRFGAYPIVYGVRPKERWQELGKILVSNNFITEIPSFLPLRCGERNKLPLFAPEEVIESYSYDYKSFPGGPGYIFRTVMNDPTRPVLETDQDGEILGLQCDDPAYCVKYP